MEPQGSTPVVLSHVPPNPHTHQPSYPYTHGQIIRCGTPDRTKQGFKCFKFALALRTERRKQKAENQNQGTKKPACKLVRLWWTAMSGQPF